MLADPPASLLHNVEPSGVGGSWVVVTEKPEVGGDWDEFSS